MPKTVLTGEQFELIFKDLDSKKGDVPETILWYLGANYDLSEVQAKAVYNIWKSRRKNQE